jgi:transcriptional regulator with XRE-family HTH domain
MDTVRKLLAANIKARRSELGLTQEKLAELVDVSYQMIHDIEGCRTWVSDKTLQRLSEALEVDIYELLCPSAADPANVQKGEFSHHLVERLHKTMKSDIDRRLDEFFGKLEKLIYYTCESSFMEEISGAFEEGACDDKSVVKK